MKELPRKGDPLLPIGDYLPVIVWGIISLIGYPFKLVGFIVASIVFCLKALIAWIKRNK